MVEFPDLDKKIYLLTIRAENEEITGNEELALALYSRVCNLIKEKYKAAVGALNCENFRKKYSQDIPELEAFKKRVQKELSDFVGSHSILNK